MAVNPYTRLQDDTLLVDEEATEKKAKGKRPLSHAIKVLTSPSLKKSEIESLSAELLISKKRLKAERKDGAEAFGEWIAKRRKKYELVLDTARRDYLRIREKYENNKGQDLLMKIVLKANYVLKQSHDNKRTRKNIGASFQIKYNNEHFLTVRDQFNTLQLISWSGVVDLDKSDNEFIGEGSHGIVQRIKNITQKEEGALKLARNDIDETELFHAKKYIMNEDKKLKLLHSQQSVEGIQKNPFASFKIWSLEKTENIYGFAQYYYNKRSLAHAIDEGELSNYSLIQRLELVLQIAKAVRRLHTPIPGIRGAIFHGDIKPANIFLHETKEKKLHAFIGDFAGAKDLENELTIQYRNPDYPPQTIVTVGFLSELDLKNCLNADCQEAWCDALKSRDFFAMSASAWETLIETDPYHIEKDNAFPNFEKGIQRFEEFVKIYGVTMGELFKKALDEDPYERPPIDDFINKIENELKKIKSISN